MFGREAKSIADGLLLDANNYISENRASFKPVTKILDTINNNVSFQQLVHDVVDDCPDEYEGLSQQESAYIVFDMYKQWAAHSRWATKTKKGKTI